MRSSDGCSDDALMLRGPANAVDPIDAFGGLAACDGPLVGAGTARTTAAATRLTRAMTHADVHFYFDPVGRSEDILRAEFGR